MGVLIVDLTDCLWRLILSVVRLGVTLVTGNCISLFKLDIWRVNPNIASPISIFSPGWLGTTADFARLVRIVGILAWLGKFVVKFEQASQN